MICKYNTMPILYRPSYVLRMLNPAHIPRPRIFWLAIGAVAVSCIAVLCAWTLQAKFDVSTIRTTLVPLEMARAHFPIVFVLLFFCLYVGFTALCIPLEIPFAISAGALFGLLGGVVLASFASIIGGTLAFLAARFLFRDYLHSRFRPQFRRLNEGVERDGVFYLVQMRLLPIMPFSLCNVLMGLTTMRTRVFFLVSQVCMIFATVIFVNAGTHLLTVRRLADIMSPALTGGLVALAILPWMGRALVRYVALMRRTPGKVV